MANPQQQQKINIFQQLKAGISNVDPVMFCEQNLTLDGEKFSLHGNGYKPFADIYRQVGIAALSPNSKPIVLVKGRQVGATTMAAAIELYFMSSGIFGRAGKPPIRVIHLFPTLVHVHLYAKTKFNPMIKGAKPSAIKKGARSLSVVESKLDKSSPTNDSLQFKQFEGDNWVRIESTGIDGDRLRGGTVDVLLYDECFPYNQKIQTETGKLEIGKIYDLFQSGQPIPKVLTYNEEKDIFEYKEVINTWCRGEKNIWKLNNIKCTGNHKFLTKTGWKEVYDIQPGELIKSLGRDVVVKKSEWLRIKETVYDIEIKDNHNFITKGLVAHNCQDVPAIAIANANKMANTSKYGKSSKGVQVYFGTPKGKNSQYYKMWINSSQNYYFLGCENCKQHFPLYTPGSNKWEKIWLYGYMVKCPECGHIQDKRDAAERGKWISTRDPDDPNVNMVGYHINQLYNPKFTRENMEEEKPENSLINTERAYQNEVLGEFFTGDLGPISREELVEKCGDPKRSMRISIPGSENAKVFAGFDWGKRSDEDQVGREEAKKAGGQSYSTCVVLREDGNRLVIDYAGIVKKNDNEYKRNYIHEVIRKYSVIQSVGDIGFAHELTEDLQRDYGDRFLGCELAGKLNKKATVWRDSFPHLIRADREYYISEVFEIMKKGLIRFPLGGYRNGEFSENSGYHRIDWLIDHCCSMEVKTTFNAVNEPVRRFIKGNTPNDGMMALVNAYIAYKYYVTKGFEEDQKGLKDKGKSKEILAAVGYCPGW